MKVTLFKKNPKVYSCNVYLVRGDWNALDDVNTLIDVGTDDYIYEELQTISTGVGKRRVEQIIITHEHFDHAGGLKYFNEIYSPGVIAFSPSLAITEKAHDGKYVKIGDRNAQVLYTPGHSNDSICIYVPEEQTLFSGDTPLFIKSPGGSYTKDYVNVLERLLTYRITKIYSGHDDPVLENAIDMLENTYKNVLKSKII